MAGNTSVRPLSLADRKTLCRVLHPGETVQWYVRPLWLPDVREFQRWNVISVAFAAFGLLFLLVALGRQENDFFSLLTAGFVVLCLSVGLLIPFLTMVNRFRTFYAVTNERVLVVKSLCPLPVRKTEPYPLASNMVVQVVRGRKGRGDIVLAFENTAPDSAGGRPRRGLLRLPQVEPVLVSLQTVAASFPPRTDVEHSRSLAWADPHSSVRAPEKCWRVISMVMPPVGALALYAAFALAEKPLDYFLHAERTVGRVVRAERDGESFLPVYEYSVQDGRRFCQSVKHSEIFRSNPVGQETVLMYFPEAPEAAYALCPVNLFVAPLFLGLWGLMFLSGGSMLWESNRRQLKIWREMQGDAIKPPCSGGEQGGA